MGIYSKKPNETFQSYRDRAINTISPSFCGAKWYNATIWLGNGQTTSCHHPPAHKIPLDELKTSYKALHNTTYKKAVRKQMLDGVRPKECDYCWKMENLGNDIISDRVHKSIIYTDQELLDAKLKLGATEDVELKTLEISFDPTCNFACSYCNSSFSTTWQKDINKNGPYQNLVSDGAGAFQHNGSHAMPYGKRNENNPYVEAFWKWWEAELQHSLRELRITGGEPTLSMEFWKLMKWWETHKEVDIDFAINSNLGISDELIDKLIDYSHNIKSFHIYTSCESVGNHAEYIRDGLNWKNWLNNIDKLLSKGNIKSLNMMMTINSLCLFSLPEFLDEMLIIKKKYGTTSPVCSFNILRFPSFQSVVTLPNEIRLERAFALENWIENNYDGGINGFMDWERDGVTRLITYLREITTGHNHTSSIESRERDFKSFYTQYDKRRGKDIIKTFPMIKEWWDSIPETNIAPLLDTVDGDDANSNYYVKDLQNQAKKEGWILTPQWANPGAQDYVEPVDDDEQSMIDFINETE
jgi:organic radical activating enzyme